MIDSIYFKWYDLLNSSFEIKGIQTTTTEKK